MLKDQLRKLRLKKGWTQGELADAAGVSRQTINNIERGRTTGSRGENLARLAGALDTTMEELMGVDTPKAPAPQLREQLAALPPDEIRTLLNGVWGTLTMDPQSNLTSLMVAERKCKELGVEEEELKDALMYIAPLAAEQLQRSQEEYERALREREEALADMEKRIKAGA